MSDEQTLVKKRGSLKGRLTFFFNYINSLPAHLSNELKLEIEVRIAKLEPLFDSYNEVQQEIESMTSNPTEQYKERDLFESMYYKAVALAKSKLGIVAEQPHNCSCDAEASQKAHGANVKLPIIQLAKFDGSYNSWLEFRDTYLSLIHDNPDLSPINKFHYLRSSLEGSALLVIKSIEFSSSNYEVAWKLICDRYDNKKMLIANHVKALFTVYSIQKDTSFNLKRLVDTFVKNLRSLTTLGEPTDKWDTLLIYMLSSKFDSQTFIEWEKFKALHEKQHLSFEDLIKFTRNRSELLEILEHNNKNKILPKQSGTHTLLATNQNNKNKKCPICLSPDHFIYYCKSFLNLSNKERETKASSLNLCLNCLRTGHNTKRCQLRACKHCNKKHNSLICPEIPSADSDISNPPGEVALFSRAAAGVSAQGLLSTACVSVRFAGSATSTSDQLRVRIMLDSGSTSNFITKRLCKQLQLPTRNVTTTINGLNRSVSVAKECCEVTIKSIHSQYSKTIICIIISEITNPWPNCHIDKEAFKIPTSFSLADPQFYIPSNIDILVGNAILWEFIEPEQIKLKNQNIILQKSKLGWFITGSIKVNTSMYCNYSDSQTLTDQLAKFWELDSAPTTNKQLEWSPEEIECETSFLKNTYRLPNGRFIVTIPLKHSPNILGDSYKLAKARFLQLEKKLHNNIQLKNQYKYFIQEYIDLGHMRLSKSEKSDKIKYFAPHHGVERPTSATTSLRVVFDCSMKSSSGYSFNELQMIGPTIQDDLFSILLRFRQHNVVITADVTKMYRQIEVSESQKCLQQILWRNEPSEPLRAYELNTVTYGTASAPFLAIRCLKQLADECSDPLIQEVISKDFYVDDLISGASNVLQALHIYTGVTNQLKSGCFPLRKWCSNDKTVLAQIKKHDDISNDSLDLCPNEISKTLGIHWDHESDNLCFNIQFKKCDKITKRNILSTISQLFDPLGLVTPAILEAKITLQKLWLCKLSWDDDVPEATRKAWHQFVNSLTELNNLRIPRHTLCFNYIKLELHIFTDASEEAYGACAYLRSVNDNNEAFVHLLCSKNKVSPLKPQTIPRLELCGALLGARLSLKILKSLRLTINEVFYWTDSTIVLGWLSTTVNKLQTFVRNRIGEIQSTTNIHSWNYVPTQLNPADYLTRKTSAAMLAGCEQWWNGPSFLRANNLSWPTFDLKNNNCSLPELKLETTCMNVQSFQSVLLFERFSSFSRMQRTMAFAIRFISNLKTKDNKVIGPLRVAELQIATHKLISICQQQSFPTEYEQLKSKKPLKSSSSILSLNPFYDNDLNVIRVGGRLRNSQYHYNKKHPFLIHKNHIFSKLLFLNEHKILMHTGPQQLLYSTRQNYWTIGGRDLARSVYRNCNTCKRYRADTTIPIMGNLPKERFCTGYAFEFTSIDLAGPVMIANKEGRGSRLIKSYICVFVCFTTKAIHLELVSDMSTAKFILALKRFISRRGKPSYIYCDNGSNFVGANNELKRMITSDGDKIVNIFAHESIKFSFSPPWSPHFGGLHEIGVKSTKNHLKRIIGNVNLTFEQLYTVLTQIEAILNSRPLSPISSNPEDLLPLTPGHFLIGKPVTSLPEPDLAEVPMHRLDRHQKIEKIRQQFWSRWHREYISELQVRTKWKQTHGSLCIGDLVLIKDDHLPPMKWHLGRIVAVYPGTDGVARVADIKTSSGIIRRSFPKICPLPKHDQD